jgi:hypothetical protein
MRIQLNSFRWLAPLIALAVALPAFAHGDKTHVMGVIEKVEQGSVTVKTREGKSVEIKLVESTTYTTADGKAIKAAKLAVGQRVAIHADSKNGALVAATVKIAAAPAAAP